MINNFRGERWKAVILNYETNPEYRLEISSHGRVRTFSRLAKGNVIKGSSINGYPIIRLKLFLKRTKKIQAELEYLREQVAQFKKNIATLPEAAAKDARIVLETVQKSLTQKNEEDVKKRTIYYHSLIHRLVAEYFLPKPGPERTVVAHLDFDKLNNYYQNLKWMTPLENIAHQKLSPYVIAQKESRRSRQSPVNGTKLSVTKVMLLKKLLNLNKPMKTLVKQFKVTETQIKRIQRGENWGDIQAAK